MAVYAEDIVPVSPCQAQPQIDTGQLMRRQKDSVSTVTFFFFNITNPDPDIKLDVASVVMFPVCNLSFCHHRLTKLA